MQKIFDKEGEDTDKRIIADKHRIMKTLRKLKGKTLGNKKKYFKARDNRMKRYRKVFESKQPKPEPAIKVAIPEVKVDNNGEVELAI